PRSSDAGLPALGPRPRLACRVPRRPKGGQGRTGTYRPRRRRVASRGRQTGGRLPLRRLPPLARRRGCGARAAGASPARAQRLTARTRPTLTRVGDKLTDAALAAAVARQGEPHRSYLQVRMPRFAFRDEELQAVVGHLIAADRVPPDERELGRAPDPARQQRY